METSRCCVCGASQAVPHLVTWDRSHGLPGTFTFVRCASCGHVYLSPRPDERELARYYPPDYSAHPTAIDDEPRPWSRWSRRYGLAKRCRVVTGRLSPGRLLDVGCGTGNFLHEMRRHGWDVAGVEPSERAAEYARQRFGLDVRTGVLDDLDLPAGSFDAVSLWQVIEHVPDPRRTLAQVRRLLRPGGLLVVSAPNAGAVDARLFGRYWVEWEAPRHLNVFTRDGALRMLHDLAFTDVAATCVAGAWYSFATSLQHAVEARRGVRPGVGFARRRAWHAARSLLGLRLLMLPYTWLTDRLVLGSTIVLTARSRPL
jgi:2-polyprenyl-3-methyl-5-hydroxy-6-metoxy-1,4-benzoquinol methylase